MWQKKQLGRGPSCHKLRAPCSIRYAPQVYAFSKEMKGKFGDGDFNLTVRGTDRCALAWVAAPQLPSGACLPSPVTQLPSVSYVHSSSFLPGAVQHVHLL